MLEVKRARLNNDEKREIAARACSNAGIRIPDEIWTPPGIVTHFPMNWDMVRFIFDRIRELGAND